MVQLIADASSPLSYLAQNSPRELSLAIYLFAVRSLSGTTFNGSSAKKHCRREQRASIFGGGVAAAWLQGQKLWRRREDKSSLGAVGHHGGAVLLKIMSIGGAT